LSQQSLDGGRLAEIATSQDDPAGEIMEVRRPFAAASRAKEFYTRVAG
jgi:hypothetical protein